MTLILKKINVLIKIQNIANSYPIYYETNWFKENMCINFIRSYELNNHICNYNINNKNKIGKWPRI